MVDTTVAGGRLRELLENLPKAPTLVQLREKN
jgi:hypothetical protein